MNRVLAVDADNLTLTVEAGCVLQQAQQAAEAAGLLFPLSLASEGSCTIGGNLASNAGGTQVLRYGNARELCLGLEVVTAQGEIWNGLSGLRKDNSGYDLRDLFIGSEGCLGIITKAVLKLQPRPARQLTALAACDSMDHALALLRHARLHLDAGLTAFEIMNQASVNLVARHFPTLPLPLGAPTWLVLLEQACTPAQDEQAIQHMLQSALARGWIMDAALASSLAQSQSMWQLREAIPLAQSLEGLNIKHDIALPTSAMSAFVAQAGDGISQRWPGARLISFGHLGDGNLHYNVQAPEGAAPQAFLQAHEQAVNQWVYDLVMQYGGSFSAEHGIGRLKREELRHRKSPVGLQLMRQIKLALDPKGRLNPGVMLPD